MVDERSALSRDIETNSRDNGYLVNQLVFKYEYNENVADVFGMRTYYDELTPMAIREAARTYLDTSRFVKVTLMPEAVTH